MGRNRSASDSRRELHESHPTSGPRRARVTRLRGRTDTLSGAGRGPDPRAFTSRLSTRFVLFNNSSILQQEVHR